jgi:hypothetical protein
VISIAYSTFAFVVLLIEDMNDGVAGAQKKLEATKRFKEMLTSVVGVYPGWLPDGLVSAAIDAIVGVANMKGWFKAAG